MTDGIAIRLKGVVRREKGVERPILDRIDASISSGSLVAVVGADGAGKTTLMRVMAGLLRPQSGSVRIMGDEVYTDSATIARAQSHCGYMPQKFGLYGDLSVDENMGLFADLFDIEGSERQERFERLLGMTNLKAFTDRPAGKLSGGMKQKLGLASVLLNRPDVLLLDEPSVGVDPLSRLELWAILSDTVREDGSTVVVATTYMDEAAKCDRVLMLEEGRVVADARPSEIAALAQGRVFRVKPRTNEGIRDLQADFYDDERCLDAVPEADGVRVLLAKATLRDRATLVSLFGGRPFEAIEPSLEDGYLVSREGRGLVKKEAAHEETGPKTLAALPSTVVSAKNLVRRFGRFTAVDRTSFEVREGEIFGLLGPNGAGKTTTFKMLCGLLAVTEGDLTVFGIDAEASALEVRERLGYMSQKFALYTKLTARENLDFFAGAYGLSPKEGKARIAELAREFDLTDRLDRPAGSLPGGVKQRLAMAAALIHRPKLLFLDEPTSGADVMARRDFWRRITTLARAGTTIIVTTHFMEEALYCDRLMIQEAGKPLVLDTPQAVRGEAATMDEAFVRIVKTARGDAKAEGRA